MSLARQASLEAIFLTAIDAIITIDEKGTIISANPAVEKIFGYRTEEIIGQGIERLIPSPDRENHHRYLTNYLTTGVRKIIGIGREVMGQRKDGSLVPIHLAVSEVELEGTRMFAGIMRDISDIKRAEHMLTQLNAELESRVIHRTQELHSAQAELVRNEKLAILGRLSAGIAHEIRNPLNAIRTSSYFLLKAPSIPTEKLHEHLQRIDRQVHHIENVINALSDVAKLPDPKVQQLDIQEMLEDAVKSVPVPGEVSVDIQVPTEPPKVLVDRHQMGIVFRNLIRNAIDAMPHGGSLLLGAEQDQERVLVFVEDSGIGMPEDELIRITEPLYTTKPHGMGLGLSISKLIIAKNGGELKIASQLGQGSRFTVMLKMASQGSK